MLVACDVARSYGVARSLIYRWRQSESAFVPAMLLDGPPEKASKATPAIALDILGG